MTDIGEPPAADSVSGILGRVIPAAPVLLALVGAGVGEEATSGATPSNLVIESLLPDPPGSDRDLEEVTLRNMGTEEVALAGWSLRDADNHSMGLTRFGSIPAGQPLTVARDGSPLSLNNGGDTIQLIAPSSIVADSVTYGEVDEGEIVRRDDDEDPGFLTICSFNIQFLGSSAVRENESLAGILNGYDIVAVQELVAPPFAGTFPNGDPFNPDQEAADFFNEMTALGFDFVLSEEDTGTGATMHNNGFATEWWVTFFRPDRVTIASDLPSGFLADDHYNHDDYERVPYAFPFRSTNGRLDFVLVSVHLKPGAGPANRARRAHELSSIAAWIDENDAIEHDFIILGDMNIQNAAELGSATPEDFASLNDECVATNTNVNGPRPYDHVMLDAAQTTEVDAGFDFDVNDLIDMMRVPWEEAHNEAYPGEPYVHNPFRASYTDHHPVVFRLTVPESDDD